MRDRANRHLATVLFVDIVDSTRIASEAGDRHWRELLGQFRRAVRRQLKRHAGREQDTAGDGFFATFERPASAVRAAAAIVDAAQALGMDVRCGLHTGELEHIDGGLGGIAAHIGARVMGLAGPADILITATVHDLVVGGGISSGHELGAELKGVPGRWALYRVVEVDGVAVPEPLTGADAIARLHAQTPVTRWTVPHPRLLVLGTAMVGALSLAGLASIVMTLPRGEPSFAGEPSPGGSAPPTMVRIDPDTNEVVAEVHDQYLPIYFGTEPLGRVFIVDGTLWQETPINLVRRDVGTGEASATIAKPQDTWTTLSGFGSLWFVAGNYLTLDDVLYRVDPLSGRTIELIETDGGGAFRDIAIGRNGIFALTSESEILTIDPAVNAVVDRDALDLESPADGIVSVGGTVWVCECADGRITQWDPVTDETIETVTFAQQGFILGDPREASLGSVTNDDGVVWLMDREAGTLTAVDPATSTAGQPIGIPQWAGEHDFGADSIWIAAEAEVYRIHLDDFHAESIPLPDGVVAGGIAVDAVTGSVWVGNFVSGR